MNGLTQIPTTVYPNSNLPSNQCLPKKAIFGYIGQEVYFP